MYKLLLILRYLRRKIAPMFAALAVMLCTAMVIIVISIMGGFLQSLTSALQTLEADVTVSGGLSGFSHYDQLRLKLEELPEVQAAAAVIQTYGLITLGDQHIIAVKILGIDGPQYDRVMQYRSSLYWTPQRREGKFSELDLTEAGMTFDTPPAWGQRPGIVLGIAISPTNRRNNEGQYDFQNSIVATSLTLNAMDISRGSPRPVAKQVIVVNESKSGIYEIDRNVVFVDFKFLQAALLMDRFEGEGDDGNPRIWPAKANDIVVRGAPGVPLEQLDRAVKQCTIGFINTRPNAPVLYSETWKQRHAIFLGAVQKEKMMLTILFAIISLVAVAMIGVIFYMIVLEKTRDIGVLRALGASRAGIGGIFLGYGVAIGIVGAVLGLGLATTIVYNINEIQNALTKHFGFTMWDPKIYYFDRIPARLDPVEVGVIMLSAVAAGLLGSILPAMLATRLRPVEALRYE